MDWFWKLFTNPFLIAGVSAWFVAQVIKTVLFAVMNKKLDFSRMYGDGGMPSGQSATVTALATMAALHYGLDSFAFAVTFILAIIVTHDATGVRRETGKQTLMINELVKAFEVFSSQDLPEVKLKEFVGHSPIQVLAGILVGFVDALLLYWIF